MILVSIMLIAARFSRIRPREMASMAVPSVVVRLLLGGEISGASIPLGRVAGFGLLRPAVALHAPLAVLLVRQ